MSQVTAFFDDSGVFKPEDKGVFAALGMVVIRSTDIRKCSESWWEMLQEHFQCPYPLQVFGIEVSSAELWNLLNRLKNGNNQLQKAQQKMFDWGLNTEERVDALVEAIFNFLSSPPVAVKYLAVVANKNEVWQRFCTDQINKFGSLKYTYQNNRILNCEDKTSNKNIIRKLSHELSSFLVEHTYEFLLQRLDYLSSDGDFDFSDAFIISDESSDIRVMLKTQTAIQAGLGEHFSPLNAIVNRPWFGSSLHDPCLQIADWIAFAARRWAEGEPSRIGKLSPNFRGYPDKILGRGIVCCPSKESFPALTFKV